MQRHYFPRDQRPDLLSRPPRGVHDDEDGWAAALVVDPIAQLDELSRLRRQGLLTEDQLEEQKAKIFRH